MATLRDFFNGKVRINAKFAPVYERLYLKVMPQLRADFARAHPRVDEDLCELAMEQAWLKFQNFPELQRASRTSLLGFLKKEANSELSNLRRGVRRRGQHEQTFPLEDLHERFQEFFLINDRARAWANPLLREEQSMVLDAIRAYLSPRDQKRLALFRDGAPLADWTEHLGITGWPLKTARQRVREVKHVLVRKLVRCVRRRNAK